MRNRLLALLFYVWTTHERLTNVEAWTSFFLPHPPSIHRTNRASSTPLPSPHNLQLHESPRTRQEDCPLLLPVPNPHADPNATSLSNVSVSAVSRGIDALYPPHELETRNAKSRSDGYWKFVERGEEPPKEFTYGEFDLEFFGQLLDRAWEYYVQGEAHARANVAHGVPSDSESSSNDSTCIIPWKEKVFCDIGSGMGRLVIAAAALHPNWKLCRGLEILQGIHDVSLDILDRCKYYMAAENQTDDDSVQYSLRVPTETFNQTNAPSEQDKPNSTLPLAPIQFTCGSFSDPYQYLGDIDCAFVFSSCMKPPLLKQLSIAIGRQFRPGSIVITTEFPLVLRGLIHPLEEDDSMPHGEYEVELLERVDGWCWLMGGESTAYIYRVKKSLWEAYAGPRKQPQGSLEEEAFRLVQLMESGELTDTKRFVRNVYNNLLFHGISLKSLAPDHDDDEKG
ncbi:hypothetical protein HJC23_011142 [Cyclotella cryptica]|uniref:Uncharacterized protein n=1 Tax=Cyclotella cryptica TaxID=29204 RepID=A0ABD3P312_9STRA|eukprot:CCRYP_018254-RA/>CCRYP_018254-RA protein AED:0.10 eAED:0.10 QI:0/-1/0/1/-1/1/1/0/451